ncbi:HNH endonuclease [Chelatococcus asaccharovorans]|uniref:HNH endonuclease n=1 Tax=Chelatococcus asaccharovorans TaxID=28210 RepID=UPI00226501A4|nr:HNH endonuclease [Chelatococcus asaccharovorans]
MMPSLPSTFRPPTSRSKRERDREHDARRREAQPWRSFYKTAAWQEARQTQLARQPLCERCLAEGHVAPATVVNHRQPHKGDWSTFIAASNHESTCKPHHDRDIQREERAATG